MNGISARLAAASGAFSVVALLVGNQLALSGAAEGTDGASALAFLQRDPTLVTSTGLVLEILGFAALLVFFAYLYRVLRRAEGPDGWVAAVALGAGLTSVAVKVGSIAPIVAGTYAKNDLTPDLARTLVDLNGAAFVVFGLLFGLFVAAAGAACVAHRVTPRWLGWAGVGIGVPASVAGLAGIVAPGGYNPLAFLGGLVWTLVLSGLLTLRVARRGDADRSETIPARADVAGVG
jgi:hypothetical protein